MARCREHSREDRLQRRDAVSPDGLKLAAYDAGNIDGPAAPERYADDRQFADDVKAVMDALRLKRPVLVAWSYAGRR